MRATVTNPLPDALSHYRQELGECLDDWTLGIWETPSAEGVRGARRALRGVEILAARARIPSADLHIVLWPTFGYFDAATWLPATRRAPVVIIVHDIDPLRRQFGYSGVARSSFRAAARSRRIHFLCHTEAAAGRLRELTGVRAEVVPHPMLRPRSAQPRRRHDPPVVRVLGQYKSARDVDALTALAAETDPEQVTLEICGRGWPPIPGWRVDARFLDEVAFSDRVATSDAILIPYRHYSQSGVMVRAAESEVPVVGLPHPQLSFLYGQDWPGVVQSVTSWLPAVSAAIAARDRIPMEVARAHQVTRAAWVRTTSELVG